MAFCSMHAIASDLKWRSLLAEKLDKTSYSILSCTELCSSDINDEIERVNKNSKIFHEENDDLLKIIAVIHQNVCRKMQVLSRGLGLVKLLMCNAFCLQICVCIFCAMQVEEIQVKIQYAVLVTPVTYTIYALCNHGQKLINESERFQQALISTTWTNMSYWKQKNLLIVMTLASKHLEMRGCGSLVMNLKMFSSIMNAAYSYYNFLNAV